MLNKHHTPQERIIRLALVGLITILLLAVIGLLAINFYMVVKTDSHTEASYDNSSFVSSSDSSSSIVASSSSSSSSSVAPKVTVEVDKAGEAITQLVESADPSFRAGFLSSKNLRSLGINYPLAINGPEVEQVDPSLAPKQIPLEKIIPAPVACQKASTLEYPDYKIVSPIQYVNYDDMFFKNPDGTYNFHKSPPFKEDLRYGDINSPVQKKLEKGVIQLASISPQPGEIGNSYIAGHSSNWSFIKSDYNQILKPLLKTSKVGETFVIWDHKCRELKFRVFDNRVIEENDITEAYRNYGDKRVVTLQTSIVSLRNGKWAPYERWLTRGELIVEDVKPGVVTSAAASTIPAN